MVPIIFVIVSKGRVGHTFTHATTKVVYFPGIANKMRPAKVVIFVSFFIVKP